MAKRAAVAALALLVGVSFSQPVRAQSLDEVLDRHYEAMGGADAWKNLKSMRASGTLSVMGGMAAGPFTLVQKRPTMYRMDYSIQGMEFVQAYNGQTAWQINPMFGSTSPEEADPATAQAIMENSDFDGPLIGWEEDGYQVELLGRAAVGAKQAFKLQLTAGDRISFFYIDPDNYRLIQVESQTAGVNATTTIDDYRRVGAVLFPFSISIQTPQAPVELLFDSIEVDVEISDGEFSIPGG